MSLYTKLYHKPYSVESLSYGLPVKLGQEINRLFDINGEAKSLFARAASRAGLKSKLVKKSLKEISSLHLPMIIMLSDHRAVILEEIKDNQIKIIGIEDEEPFEKIVEVEQFADEYLGFGFILRKKFSYYDRGHNSLKVKYKHWFWDTIKISKPIYKDVLLASILINLFVLATPLFTMNVYDRVIPNNSVETLYVFAFGVIVIYLIDSVLKYIRSYFLEVAAKKSDVIISSIIFEKVMDIKISSFPPSVGSFASNLKDFDTLRSFLTNATLTTLIDLPFVIIFLIVIYYIGGPVVFIPLITIILMLIFAFVIKNPLKRSIEETHQVSAKKNSILIESLQNIETLKTLGMSGHMQWEWEENVGELAKKSFKSKFLSNLIPNVTGFFIQLNTVFIVFYGVFLIKDFELTMGALIAVVILTSRVVAPMGQTVALITNYEDAKTSYNVLNNIMELPSEHSNEKSFINMPKFSGKIEFRNVSFQYPNTDILVLDDISFTINPGEKIAIIGRIGSGKSTIEKLILKLYEPSSGSILIDGIDINQIDTAELRKNIGYVSQDIDLFKGSIKDNIIYRASNADDESMLRASKISGADEFISKHPLGYDMPIEEKGMGLSGGQKQSVGIARAFLYDSPIMLFDEPSNAMDQLTEINLIQSLHKNLEDKTSILVTQKMSILDVVQRVIVLQNGKIFLDGQKDKVLDALRGNFNG